MARPPATVHSLLNTPVRGSPWDGMVCVMTSLDPTLIDLASSQAGMFTTSQAHVVGMDKSSLCRGVADKVLLHPTRSLYAVSHLVDSSSPRAWHEHLARGAELVYPDLVLTGVTAVLAHGLAVWGCELDRPVLLRPIHRSVGVRGFWVRPLRDALSVESPWGPTVPLTSAVVQVALDCGIEQAVVCADDGLRQSLFTVEDLTRAAGTVANWPRAHRARSMAQLVSAERESVGESRCGVAMAVAGIRACPQVEVRDDSGRLVARVDWLVEGTKVVVEFDGKVKFASGDPEVLWAEKRREDALRRLGYTVVRITWADLERPGAVAAKIRAAMRQSA